MESYYHNQANLTHFAEHYRQAGTGFRALALGIGRVTSPLAQKFSIHTVEKIGNELLLQVANTGLDLSKDSSREIGLRYRSHNQTSFIMAALKE